MASDFPFPGDDHPGRFVPVTFEDYTAALPPAEPGATCTGCMSGAAAITADEGNFYCAECLRHAHGYDAAEEVYARTLVGVAVTTALALGADPALVVQAVRDAFAERITVDAPTIT